MEIIKELFFTARKSLYVIYREVCTGNSLDREGFLKLVSKYSNSVISLQEISDAFDQVCSSFPVATGTKDYLTFNEFHKAFTVLIPDPEVFQDEVRILQIVQQWMAEKSYSSEQMFQFLLKSV